MPTFFENLVNRLLRDHEGYTGDGQGNEGALPTGDETTAARSIYKRDLRELFLHFEGAANTISGAQAAADRANAAADGLLTYHGRLQEIMARMAAGDAVTFACFGDSTTDGLGTSGWTENPTVDNAAVGSGAHNPPNAWPAFAQDMLRRMYKSDNITLWNAGYSGRSIITGWAVNNYETAVINNPAYGVPDVCIIAFGLNDIDVPGYTADLFQTRLRELIFEVISYGSIPVILTPDPVIQDTARQGGSISRLTAILKGVADDYGIDVIDSGRALETVFSGSGSNNLWAFHQADDLHFGNVGHRVKASFIAASLFTNTLWLNSAETSDIAPWSKHANSHELQYGVFDGVNNRFGACINVALASYTAGEPLLDLWVWSDRPDLEAYWRSVASDGYFNPAPLASAPTLEAHSFIFPSATSIKSSTAGASQQGLDVRESETPVKIAGMAAGLTRLSFLAPTDTVERVLNLGYFSIRKARTDRVTAINGFWGNTGSGRVVYDLDPAETQSMLIGGGFTRAFTMLAEVAMPIGAGVFIYSGRVFDDGSGGANRKSRGVVLQRRATQLALVDVVYNNGGVISATDLGVANYTWSDDNNEFTIRAGAGNGSQHTLQVTPATVPLGPVLTVTRDRTAAPWVLGGKVGAIYKDYGISNAAGRVRFAIYGV